MLRFLLLMRFAAADVVVRTASIAVAAVFWTRRAVGDTSFAIVEFVQHVSKFSHEFRIVPASALVSCQQLCSLV